MKLEFFSPTSNVQHKIPLFLDAVEAGFPSFADDHVEKRLDLNELLIKHPAATFFVRVKGQSMIDQNIHPGDILIVDRSLQPKNGSIVIVAIDGQFTVKIMKKTKEGFFLMPANSAFKPIELKEQCCQLFGVVSYVIHKA